MRTLKFYIKNMRIDNMKWSIVNYEVLDHFKLFMYNFDIFFSSEIIRQICEFICATRFLGMGHLYESHLEIIFQELVGTWPAPINHRHHTGNTAKLRPNRIAGIRISLAYCSASKSHTAPGHQKFFLSLNPTDRGESIGVSDSPWR